MSDKKGKSEGTRCMQGFETDPKNSLVDAQVHWLFSNVIIC